MPAPVADVQHITRSLLNADMRSPSMAKALSVVPSYLLPPRHLFSFWLTRLPTVGERPDGRRFGTFRLRRGAKTAAAVLPSARHAATACRRPFPATARLSLPLPFCTPFPCGRRELFALVMARDKRCVKSFVPAFFSLPRRARGKGRGFLRAPLWRVRLLSACCVSIGRGSICMRRTRAGALLSGHVRHSPSCDSSQTADVSLVTRRCGKTSSGKHAGVSKYGGRGRTDGRVCQSERNTAGSLLLPAPL